MREWQETLERIALLHLDDTALPEPVVDPDLEKRPAYERVHDN